MPLARASELDRLLSCAGSLLLPRHLKKSSKAGEAADWGTYVHRWKETGIILDDSSGFNSRWARRLKSKLKASGLKRTEFWPPAGQHEVTLALNVVTLEVKVPPAHQLDKLEGQARVAYLDAWKGAWGDDYITGTLDYVLELCGMPWIEDLKTGRRAHPKDFEAQQALYGLGYSLKTYSRVVDVRSTIAHWPIYPRDGLPKRVGGVITVGFFNNFIERLRDLRERVLHAKGGGRLRLFAGDQCEFCPSSPDCPKLKGVSDYV